MSNDKKTGYDIALKSTTVFGGVQIVNVLLSIAKSKIIALLLGPIGFGILGIFNTTVHLISTISNLGLRASAVREISASNANNDLLATSKTIKAIQRWVIVTGLLGAVATIILSPFLSQKMFQSKLYSISFVVLSAAVFSMGIYDGQYALLQGMRKISLLAKANLYGSLLGFLCSVCVILFFREKGIAWSIVVAAVATTFISTIYSKKIKVIPVKQTAKESFQIGINAAKLGIAMSIASMATYLMELVLKAYISNHGSISDVGLYQAGWSFNSAYIGVVFTAMGKDYFPRLSEQADDNDKMSQSINIQGEIALLLLFPIISIMLVFLPLVIQLLYTKEFLPIVAMTQLLLMGTLLKAGGWAISFSFLAKNAKFLYLFTELISIMLFLPLYILLYSSMQLTGIGIAFVINYLIYLLIVSMVSYRKYSIRLYKSFFVILLVSFLTCALYIVSWHFFSKAIQYLVSVVVVLISFIFSYIQLNKRISLSHFIKSLFHKQ